LILFISTFKNKKEKKMTKRIILVRHGQSLEDIDPTMHNIKSGRVAELTEIGRSQVNELGLSLQEKLKRSDKLLVYVSPALRAQETWAILSTQIDSSVKVQTDQRIRNLNWGNITLENRATVEAQRYETGVLNFTFPEGDHTPDYVNAINDFLESVVVPFKDKEFDVSTLFFITHGFALRVILKYLLALSDKDFRWLRNPPNCYMVELVYSSTTDSFSSTEQLLKMDII
jgi:broad specificity phosphatase PhoE